MFLCTAASNGETRHFYFPLLYYCGMHKASTFFVPALLCLALIMVLPILFSNVAAVASTSSAKPAASEELVASAESAASANCPLKPTSAIPSGDVWEFTANEAPSTPHPGIASAYTHGRGTWSGGRGSGTICHEDSAPGRSSRDLVLSVGGAAKVSPHVTRLGLLGVGLVLGVTVVASDDSSCLVGTRGVVTLFTSYYAVHRDSLQFRFVGGCVGDDSTYLGSKLVALIANDGAQVN